MKERRSSDINKIIVHCSDSTWGDADVIDEWHRERGFDQIGYHYVITNGVEHSDNDYDEYMDGIVQEGRLLKYIGAHCRGQNTSSIGICLIGKHSFTFSQFQALASLIDNLQEDFEIEYIEGHYAYSSKTCPNFDVESFVEVFLR